MSHKCRAERRQWAWDEKVGNADDQAAAADAIVLLPFYVAL